MNLTVEATYENGVLKLAEPLPLKEHQKVRVTIESHLTWADAHVRDAPLDRRPRGPPPDRRGR